MYRNLPPFLNTIRSDLIAGTIVFLVGIPLSLGIALASGAPIFSGLIAAIMGGILVGILSGSQTSISGPTAGLSALVFLQITSLGSFELFLTALVLAGTIQIIFGISKIGKIAAFFPVSVIKGLLFGIGALLILKQIPHLFGYDSVPFGDDAFQQHDKSNTLYSFIETFFNIDLGASFIGLLSLTVLIFWDKFDLFKKTVMPGPLFVIFISVLVNVWLKATTQKLWLDTEHLVQIPFIVTYQDLVTALAFPDWQGFYSLAVYQSAFVLGCAASLETLLNIEAVDKIDPKQRTTPPNRELIAQGAGNIASGLIGGLPVASLVVRSSISMNMGGQTKLSAITNGSLILFSIFFLSSWINEIPIATLAAILLVTGWKLANLDLAKQMWAEGKYHFFPFAATVLGIIATDTFKGVILGLVVSLCFILYNNLKHPFHRIVEKHTAGDEVHHITFPTQVGFFHKPALEEILNSLPKGGHALINAERTDYIDPDIVDLLIDFQKGSAKIHNIKLSTVGFAKKGCGVGDQIHYRDVHNKETQKSLTPWSALKLLAEGNTRFREGRRLLHYVDRQLNATANGQFPMAVMLSCIDSRTPAELVFDLSLGDIFSVRVAGNIVTKENLASMEFACAVAGSKLIVVMGHTSCGAVKATVDLTSNKKTAYEATQCDNLDCLVEAIQVSINPGESVNFANWSQEKQQEYVDRVAKRNVQQNMTYIRKKSKKLDELISKGQIGIVGAMYNIATGEVSFFDFATGTESLTREIAAKELVYNASS